MRGLEVVVVVLAAVLTMTWLARRLRWNEPVMLVAGGCLIGLIPDFRGPALRPEVVLLLFLPPLLYWESLTTSLREIRTNVRGIVLLATGLVLATAAAVASVGHALGLSWPLAFVLGAVVAPTDAIAVAAVARGLPRRIRTILRAESLINDGTALTLYAVVIGVAVEGLAVTWTDTAVRFLLAYAGGAAIGCGCAAVVVALRRRLRDRGVENALGVLTPFATYLPAQVLGVSGVLAVVTCGLILSQAHPKVISAGSRVQISSFWEVSTSLLNSALFVLVGVQTPAIVSGIGSVPGTRGHHRHRVGPAARGTRPAGLHRRHRHPGHAGPPGDDDARGDPLVRTARRPRRDRRGTPRPSPDHRRRAGGPSRPRQATEHAAGHRRRHPERTAPVRRRKGGTTGYRGHRCAGRARTAPRPDRRRTWRPDPPAGPAQHRRHRSAPASVAAGHRGDQD